MDPITLWIIVAIVVGVIVLRIFFKLAKMFVVIAILIVIGIVVYNALSAT
jgi:hypothetical protein